MFGVSATLQILLEGNVENTKHRDWIMQVSLSSQVMQMVKMVPRGFTATADAYLTPHIMRSAWIASSGHSAQAH